MSEIKLWLAAENERLEAELAAANAYRAALKESKNGAIHIARKLSAELATANAKIEAVRVIHRLDVYVKRRSDGQRYCGADWEAYPCSTIRALESATPKPPVKWVLAPQGSLAGSTLREEKPTIYKCVCQFSGTNVKTRKDGDDDYWTCPGCRIEYGPVLPYGLGPQRPFAGNPLRHTTKEDDQC